MNVCWQMNGLGKDVLQRCERVREQLGTGNDHMDVPGKHSIRYGRSVESRNMVVLVRMGK